LALALPAPNVAAATAAAIKVRFIEKPPLAKDVMNGKTPREAWYFVRAACEGQQPMFPCKKYLPVRAPKPLSLLAARTHDRDALAIQSATGARHARETNLPCGGRDVVRAQQQSLQEALYFLAT
jgi:hypothetical protein